MLAPEMIPARMARPSYRNDETADAAVVRTDQAITNFVVTHSLI
jgi:hypothetical protein